jgi:hypothetical protein
MVGDLIKKFGTLAGILYVRFQINGIQISSTVRNWFEDLLALHRALYKSIDISAYKNFIQSLPSLDELKQGAKQT